ncbi:MAG: hypothetical protein L0220_18255, partial [Acidobacteria bacterium]|nr:hypothetical protein [Acidobacteriota bacterium]
KPRVTDMGIHMQREFRLVRVESLLLLLLTTAFGCTQIRPIQSPISTKTMECISKVLSPREVHSTDISPSGHKLAVLYRTKTTGLTELAVIDLPTGSVDLTIDDPRFDPASATEPINVKAVRWSSIDERLFYLVNDVIREIDLRTRVVTTYVDCKGCRKFDFKDDRVVAIRDAATSNSLELVIGRRRSISSATVITSANVADGDVSISPNQTYVAYPMMRSSPQGAIFTTNIMNLSSGQIITSNVNFLSPSWISDSILLVPDKTASKVWALNATNEQLSEFAAFSVADRDVIGIAGVAAVPRSRYLVFQTDLGFPADLYIADMACLQSKRAN